MAGEAPEGVKRLLEVECLPPPKRKQKGASGEDEVEAGSSESESEEIEASGSNDRLAAAKAKARAKAKAGAKKHAIAKAKPKPKGKPKGKTAKEKREEEEAKREKLKRKSKEYHRAKTEALKAGASKDSAAAAGRQVSRLHAFAPVFRYTHVFLLLPSVLTKAYDACDWVPAFDFMAFDFWCIMCVRACDDTLSHIIHFRIYDAEWLGLIQVSPWKNLQQFVSWKMCRFLFCNGLLYNE